jgi:hypothetical protein
MTLGIKAAEHVYGNKVDLKADLIRLSFYEIAHKL